MSWISGKYAGVLSGLAGGIAGLAAMDYTTKTVSRVLERRSQGAQGGAQQGAARQGDSQPRGALEDRSVSLVGVQHEEGEPATEALARLGYRKLTGREPPREQKRRLGDRVHQGHGLLMAGLYGAVRQRYPGGSDTLAGAAYGVALWLLGDELAVPLLGLSDKPTAFPASVHVKALLGHIAYGATLGATAGGLRRLSERASAAA